MQSLLGEHFVGISTALRVRDDSLASIANFCRDYQTSLTEQDRLKKSISQLEREKAALQSEKDGLLLRMGVGSVQSNAELEGRLRELDANVLQLQSQLTEAYRRNSDNVEKMLAAVSQQREAESRCAVQEHECRVWKERCQEAQAVAERVGQEMREREVTLQAMRLEVQAVQARLVEREKKLKEVEQENQVLIERWLHYKNEEAERMNQQNVVLLQQKKLQSERQKEELLEKGRQIMSEENKGKASMLDQEGSSSMLGGVMVRLPTHARKDFVGHQGEANCVAYAQSGNRFCTGGADMRIKVWDSRTGAMLTQFSGSVGSVMCCQWSSNEQFLLGCACDNSARVWDVNMGRVRHTLTGHIGKVYAGVFSADSSKVITGAHDRTVKVWDMTTGNTTKTIFCFSSCNDVCVSEAYAHIASAHLDGAVRLWDMRTGEATKEYKDAHSKQITSIAACPTEPLLLTSARDNLLKVWDLRKHECVATLKDDAFRSGLNWSRACWSPDGKYAAAGGAEGSLFVWQVSNGNLVKQIGSESNATISCVAWSPTGGQLVTTDRKSKVILWE